MQRLEKKNFEMRGEGGSCWLLMLGRLNAEGEKGETWEGRVDGLVIY